jgi:hypothetical protein
MPCGIIMQRFGTIIATEDGPSTSGFSFVIDKEADVKKGHYVEATTTTGSVFGMVSEIYRANRYFERAETVADYESVSGMEKHFPSGTWEYSIAKVRILGSHRDDKFIRTFSPPSPGNQVFCARNEILKSFLGFVDNGVHLGSIQHHEEPAKFDMTRLLQKHLAILAMSGAGKSHLSSVMLEELLDRKTEGGRMAVVVIDIHGEYIGFGYDDKYSEQTTVVDCNEMRIPLKYVSSGMIREWLPNLSNPQKEMLEDVLDRLKKEKQDSEGYSMEDLMEAVEQSESSQNESVRKALKRGLKNLARNGFISSDKEFPRLADSVLPGKMLILDMSEIDNPIKRQALVAYTARRLLKLRRQGKIPPFLLLIEEAHNFASNAEAKESIARNVIETIAREGRKFGACLCLISQRPVNLSTTALSQCNSHIILRVTNPYDLDHIQRSSEGIDSHITKSITGLRVGEAIVVGEASNHPVFVSVRGRNSQKKEKGKPLADQAREYEEQKKQKDEDVAAFL